MSDFLRWEHDREAFKRCVAHRLLDTFSGVIYRDTQTHKIVIDIGSVSYFKSDEEFFAFRESQADQIPTWVKRSKDLHAFQKTLSYIVEFLRRIEVYSSTKQLMDEYEKTDSTKPNLP